MSNNLVLTNIKKILVRFIFSIEFLIIWFNRKNIKKGVVIVKLDAIGDFVIWLDSAKEYRKIYPKEEIILVANILWADLAKLLPYWDKVIAIDIKFLGLKKIYKRWRILAKISRIGARIAIEPTYSRKILFGDSIIRATSARSRVCSIGDFNNISVDEKKISNKWYTSLVDANSNTLMELIRNNEFYSNYFGRNYEVQIPKIKKIESYKVSSKDYFIIFPGASWEGRRWSANKFAEIATYIQDKYSLEAVLCGSISEMEICTEVENLISGKVINLAGKTTLPQLVEVIRKAEILIGNETSAIHISAAVSTPSVCILGGGHFGRFLPYPISLRGNRPKVAYYSIGCEGCNWRCIYPQKKEEPVRCIGMVTVESIKPLVDSALNI